MGNESVHDIKMDNDEDAIEETQPDQRQTIKNKKMEELDQEKKIFEENVFDNGSFKPQDIMLLGEEPDVMEYKASDTLKETETTTNQ